MKQRADQLLVERGLAGTIEEARSLLMAGEVWSQERRIDKAGELLDTLMPLEVRGRRLEFVSRGGEKLKYALDKYNIPVKGRIAIDVGSSTGGFTDCLLKRGAQHVFAVDVGYGLIDASLRADSRVSLLEKTNARLLKKSDLLAVSTLADRINLLVTDVSFISLRKIIPPLLQIMPSGSSWILLFKPQFELASSKVLAGGIVKDLEAVQQALSDFNVWMKNLGFILNGGPESSPLTGKRSGNVEYLIFYENSKFNSSVTFPLH